MNKGVHVKVLPRLGVLELVNQHKTGSRPKEKKNELHFNSAPGPGRVKRFDTPEVANQFADDDLSF